LEVCGVITLKETVSPIEKSSFKEVSAGLLYIFNQAPLFSVK
jgi:hypothetical protein